LENNLSESLENYLRAVYTLQIDGKVPRIKDISNMLAVKDASAAEAIKRLEKEGYVKHERYGYVNLTDKGMLAAERVYRRYIILIDFLVNVLGISKEQAYNIACGIEHHMTDNFYISLDGLMLFLKRNPIEFNKAKEFISKYQKSMPHDLKTTLWDLEPSESCEVLDISGGEKQRKNLISKGATPGLRVKVVGKTQNYIEVLANEIIIRLTKNEAKHVIVAD